MIDDWQDEWDLKRHGSDRSVNRHDTCRGAAYLNKGMKLTRPVQIAASQLIAAVKEDIWNLLRCCVRMGRARIRRLRHQRRLWDMAFEGASPVQRARKIPCVFTIPTIGEGIKGSRCCSHALT